MTIELLYPEICNLYGELKNMDYLCQCLPEAQLVKTSLKATPRFMVEQVDLIYICSTTERGQELVINALRPYKEKLQELIAGGTVFLVTGNALELFVRAIELEDSRSIEGLGLFDLTARRQMMRRYNSLYLGTLEDLQIVGFKSQFSHLYGEAEAGLFQTVRGDGRHPGMTVEGIRKNNFMATYVLGPLLVLNPPFTKYLLGLLGAPDREVAFEAAAMEAYNLHLKEFTDPKTMICY